MSRSSLYEKLKEAGQ
ncbi:hypothetical protein [Aliamphritea spongicola]|nr:hypothetical protein [Aliamphritea spongicola]